MLKGEILKIKTFASIIAFALITSTIHASTQENITEVRSISNYNVSVTTIYQNMLVFRRAKVAAKPAQTPPQPNLAARVAEPAMVEKKIIAKPKPTAETGDEKPASDKKTGESANLAAQ